MRGLVFLKMLLYNRQEVRFLQIRKVLIEEFDKVLSIYSAARQIMRENGNLEQWGDGYPYPEIIKSDIETGALYGVEENGELCAVFAFLENPDPDYNELIEGAWLNENPYRPIHRVASNGKKKGVLSIILDFCKSFGVDLKIDTHRDNKRMQHLLLKNGFVYCGVALLLPDKIRLAYQYAQK